MPVIHPFRRKENPRAVARGLLQQVVKESSQASIAFSSEVETGSREENASKRESRASVLILSEPIML
jgi:hypothetical protein